jgi:hypothetical protein
MISRFQKTISDIDRRQNIKVRVTFWYNNGNFYRKKVDPQIDKNDPRSGGPAPGNNQET